MTIAVLLTANTQAAVTAQVGEIVQVELKDISSTGFRWQWRSDPAGLVALEGENQRPGEAPGAAGVRRFSFRALAVGTTTLEFTLRRPWETTAAAADTRHVQLTVK